MPRSLTIIFTIILSLAAGCSGPAPTQVTPSVTSSPLPKITLLPTSTPLPPTATLPLAGSATPTPLPTDENARKPLFHSAAESANQGQHSYTYDCIAWAPCQCLVVVPRQFDIGFNFDARSVDLQAGDYSQTYQWKTDSAYANELGTLATQLTFFEDGFELYTVIDRRSCTQERYHLLVPTP